MKILLAEDDLTLGRMLKNVLGKQGFSVKWVTDGKAACQECYKDGFDVLVLDWMMPKMDGISVCKQLRSEDYQGKILLLTARDSIDDRVQGLNSGADDYLVKPFAISELTARLHALNRRQGSYINENLEYKGFVLKGDDYTISYNGDSVELRPREYKLLEFLLRNAGKIIPRDVLLERIWGIDGDITENNLDVHISALRRKLKKLNAGTLIKTIRGVGYAAGTDVI